MTPHDLALLQIPETASIADAFRRLNENQAGILFVTDAAGGVVGAVTDGDIRRHLLDDPDVEAPLATCMNRDFVWVPEGAPRETVLKLLDHRIRAVPMLADDRRLLDMVTRQNFRLDAPRRIFVRARAPVRVTFGGGGTDVTRHFVNHGGAVMNAAVGLYARALLRRTENGAVRIVSHDLARELTAGAPRELALDGTLDLIVSVVRLIDPDFGFELEVASDVPVGSGLGGSASVVAAVIGCFNQLREDRWDRHEIAEMAFQAERLLLDIPGGWQDQYATVFGGLNFMEFTRDHNTVLPLRIEPDFLSELEECLLLCYTGVQHESGEMHKKTKMSQEEALRFAEESRRLTLEMKRCLMRGRFDAYGKLLGETWRLKRDSAPHVSSPALDRIYATAIESGALGGRLLGAGGGGHFLFYAPPFARHGLRRSLEAAGLKTVAFTFDTMGLQSWTTREANGAR